MPCSASSISNPPEYSALWYADRIAELESECSRLHSLWHDSEEKASIANAELKERNKHIRELADASSVLWDEHKEYSEDLHGIKGCDLYGSDSEGHAMMQALIDATLSYISLQNMLLNETCQD